MSSEFAKTWERYATKVMPKQAGPVQMKETRRAFYAGGAALMNTILRVLSEGHEPTQEDYDALEDLNREFHAFTTDVEEGRA